MLQGTASVVFALILGLVGVGFVVWQLQRLLQEDTGSETMQTIAAAIQEGAAAFLNREYTILAFFVAVVTLIIAVFLSWQTAVCFLAGAVTSALAGYLGMWTAVRANVRTAAAAAIGDIVAQRQASVTA